MGNGGSGRLGVFIGVLVGTDAPRQTLTTPSPLLTVTVAPGSAIDKYGLIADAHDDSYDSPPRHVSNSTLSVPNLLCDEHLISFTQPRVNV